jgi:diguanylate cyclase (GGDEF)-like protein/PAS domain S-box-containing protein
MRTESGADGLRASSGAFSAIGRHIFLSFCFVLLYVGLSSPNVIIVSHLGFTVWYPAVGLIFALLLGVSPWYVPLAVLVDILVGAVVYHQPLHSWSETSGSIGPILSYTLAAYLLRGPLPIDLALRHRTDVVRYVFVALFAAAGATGLGVASLAADHTITWAQYWSSAAGWYAGDAIGLLGFAPFLLVHVLPFVRGKLLRVNESRREAIATRPRRRISGMQIVELLAQILSIPFTLWFVFAGPLADKQLYYLAYLPIIWIGMRQGLRRVVTALVIFNFAIVLTLRIILAPPDLLAKVGFLMVVMSGVGLIIGSTVTERHRIGKQLGEQTLSLSSLIENSPLGIIVNDREGRVKLCNDAFEALFLFRREEVLGKDIDSFIVPHKQTKDARQLHDLVASGKKVKATLQRERKDGHLIDVEVNAVPLSSEGDAGGTLTIYADVSEGIQVAARLKNQADALERSLTELQARTDQANLLNEMGDFLQACETSAEAVAVLTKYGGKLFPSASSGALFTFKSSRNILEVEGKWGKSAIIESTFVPDSCWALRTGQPHWSEVPGTNVVCDHLRSTGSFRALCLPMMARGETLGILNLRYEREDNDDAVRSTETWRQSERLLAASVARQVGLSLAALKLRETLRDQSIRDPLTGLFNRRFMQQALDRELQRGRRKERPVAVIFIDIDHFKRFNDIFGHNAGDAVLRAFAELMRTFFRGDDVICRYGGEEFALILPESNEQNAAVRMKDFGKKVKEMSILHEGRTLDRISISVGVAAFPRHGSSGEEVLRNADNALYSSKAEGRDRVSIAV